MKPQLIDQLYEAAFVPERWPAVLGELAEIATARSGLMYFAAADINFWTGSSEVARQVLRPLVTAGFITTCQRWVRAHRLHHAGFIVDTDIFSAKELETDPFYRDLLYPRGLGHMAGTVFRLPTGEDVSLSLERELTRGPVEREAIERLDALRPHVARAALISARLRLERARAISAALAAFGLPVLVLAESGKVLATNDLMVACTGFLRWRAADRITLKDKAADSLLRDCIATIDVEDAPCVRSFPVRDIEAETAMVAHIVPVRLTARDIFTRSIAVLVLTPAEARVARNLAEGKTIEDIAADSGVSSNTVRTQVRGVLQKTGCNRQAEVVALLAGISPARG